MGNSIITNVSFRFVERCFRELILVYSREKFKFGKRGIDCLNESLRVGSPLRQLHGVNRTIRRRRTINSTNPLILRAVRLVIL